MSATKSIVALLVGIAIDKGYIKSIEPVSYTHLDVYKRQEYNYEPNAVAQSLKAKHSHTIGIIAPCLDSITSSRMLMAIEDVYKRQIFYCVLT